MSPLSPPHQSADAPVTIERLERCLVAAAYVVTRHGTWATPIFDQLERELIAMKSGQDPIARARRVLDAYTVAGDMIECL
jgi:hypothetical protein